MILKKSPKMTKNKPGTMPKKQPMPRHLIYKICSEKIALDFLKIKEFLDTVDKLYISRFFAIRRCKPRKASKINTKMHPETHQNPTKSTLEKTLIFVTDFGMILASKMTPK